MAFFLSPGFFTSLSLSSETLPQWVLYIDKSSLLPCSCHFTLYSLCHSPHYSLSHSLYFYRLSSSVSTNIPPPPRLPPVLNLCLSVMLSPYFSLLLPHFLLLFFLFFFIMPSLFFPFPPFFFFLPHCSTFS